MSRKIVYLVNPISGTRSKSALKDLIAAGHRRQGIGFDILDTHPEGDYRYLREQIREQGITDVVVCGGDGSVNAVAQALLGVPVNMGIVPLGSGNGLALSAKIPRQTSRALELVFTGAASYIDGFFINERFSCMLCGIGFDAKVAHDFSRQKKRGLQTYLKVTAANYLKAEPYPFGITVEGKTFSIEAYFISIANSNQFGNHFTIAPGASLSDGLLDIVIVRRINKLILPFVVLQHVAGPIVKHPPFEAQAQRRIIHFQTASLTIVNQQHAPLHIDGDPASSAGTFNIRVVSHAIRLIRPK